MIPVVWRHVMEEKILFQMVRSILYLHTLIAALAMTDHRERAT
jgi:hypothetical protein